MSVKNKSKSSWSDPIAECPAPHVLVLYAEKRLKKQQAEELASHLADCRDCQSVVADLLRHNSRAGVEQTSIDAKEESGEAPPKSIWNIELLPSGTKLGRYVIIGKIGAGGMGEVHSAYDPELDRKIALKLVHLDHSDEPGGQANSRLLREAQAMAKLSHPNVITVYDVQEIDGDLAIAMEFIEGMTLGQWCKAEKRSWKEVLKMYIHAGEGLNAAHKAGLVHRDFKPDNVLVRKDGRVFVTDFGLVRQANEESKALGNKSMLVVKKEKIVSQKALSANLTKTGTLMGTPAYMAPEQLQGKEVDARADQYSFFVSLYEGLFGERPIEAKSLEEYQELTNSKEIVVPKKNDVPLWLRTKVLMGLSKNPKERFGSMSEALSVLRVDPVRKRNSRLILTTVLILTAIGGALGAKIASRPGVHCDSMRDDFVGIWDKSVKVRIRNAFLANNVPNAEDIVNRIVLQLDSYTTNLTDELIQVCHDTHSRKMYSSEIMDLRVGCLRELEDSVKIFVRKISTELDKHTVENVERALSNLPQVSSCMNSRSLIDANSKLKEIDQNSRGKIESYRKQLREVQIADSFGKYEQSREQVAQVILGAKELNFGPLLSQAYYWSGRCLEHLGQYDLADEHLSASMRISALTGDLQVYAESLMLYLTIMVIRHEHPIEAKAIYDSVAGVLKRVVETYPQLQNRHIKLLADLSFFLGNFDEAARHYQEQYELQEANNGLLHQEMGVSVYNKGYSLMRAGNFEAARYEFERAISLIEKSTGPTHDLIGHILVLVGRSGILQGEYSKSIANIEKGLSIVENALGKDHYLLSTSLITYGDNLVLLGRLAEARESFLRALRIAENSLGPQVTEAGLAHIGLGDVCVSEREYKAAEKHYKSAVAVFEKSPQNRTYLARAMFGLAKSLRLERVDTEQQVKLATAAEKILESENDYYSKIALAEISTWRQERGVNQTKGIEQ